MADRDYYQILNIDTSASTDEIKKAYRRLAMQCHPDRNHGNEEWAHAKFKQINEAFSVLGDPGKRRQYDRFGTVGNIDDILGSEYTCSTCDDIAKDFGGDGLRADFIDTMFGGDFRGRSHAFRRFRNGFTRYEPVKKGRTRFEEQAGFDLEDLFKNTTAHEIPEVVYKIELNRTTASRGMEKELVRRGKRLKVKIPPGVRTGSEIRLRNALEATDGKPGDIIIRISVNS